MYLHPQRANIPLQGLDRHALTVGDISDPHSQIGALLWYHFTSRGFTWSAKSIQGKQTSQTVTNKEYNDYNKQAYDVKHMSHWDQFK